MPRAEIETGSKFGVLLTLRGGPANIEDVAPFLRAVTGSEPSAEALQEAVVRYLTIGGGSPAVFAAERIAAALERKLNGLPEAESGGDDLRAYAVQGGDSGRAEGPVDVPVAVGCLLSVPSIAEAVARLEAAGCERIVHADLGPLESDEAIGARAEAVRAAARVEVLQAAPFVTSPTVLGFFTESAATAWGEIGTCKQRMVVFGYLEDRPGVPVDVPERATALIDDLMEELHLSRTQGAAGPDAVVADGGSAWAVVPIGDTAVLGNAAGERMIAAVEAAVEAGSDGVTVVPVGYTVDDDATLHLIDVLAADSVLSRGFEFSRASVPNDSPILAEALRLAVRTVL